MNSSIAVSYMLTYNAFLSFAQCTDLGKPWGASLSMDAPPKDSDIGIENVEVIPCLLGRRRSAVSSAMMLLVVARASMYIYMFNLKKKRCHMQLLSSAKCGFMIYGRFSLSTETIWKTKTKTSNRKT